MADDTTETTESTGTTETDEDVEAQEALAQAADDSGDTDQDNNTTGATEEGDDNSTESKLKDTVDRSEFTKVVKERQDAKKRLREAEKELEKVKRQTESESEKAKREAREKAVAEIEGKYKPLVVRTSAEAELVASGVAKDKVSRMVKLMDLDDLQVDEDGNVDGITAEVTRLQEEYPELFAQPEPEVKSKPRTAKSADGADKPPAKPKMSTTQVIAQGLRGGK